MVRRKRYTDDFRASTVLMLEAAGYPDTKGALSRVSVQVGAPISTISRWFHGVKNPPPPELANEKRIDLVAAIKNEVYEILGEMPSARSEADYRALATALGIMVDKLQLLSGKPTERSENTHIITDLGMNMDDL